MQEFSPAEEIAIKRRAKARVQRLILLAQKSKETQKKAAPKKAAPKKAAPKKASPKKAAPKKAAPAKKAPPASVPAPQTGPTTQQQQENAAFCKLNPTSPKCASGEQQPQLPPASEKICKMNPTYPGCDTLGGQPGPGRPTGSDVKAPTFCESNPQLPQCQPENSQKAPPTQPAPEGTGTQAPDDTPPAPSFITPPPLSCADGQENVLGFCVPVCPSGEERVSGFCVPECPAGEERVLGICVPVVVGCPEGQELVVGICVAACGPGFERFNNICVRRCPGGTPRVNGICQLVCDEGLVNRLGRCVLECPSGFELTNGICIPQTQCFPGYTRGPLGICVELVCPPGQIPGDEGGVCKPKACTRDKELSSKGVCERKCGRDFVWRGNPDRCLQCPDGSAHDGANVCRTIEDPEAWVHPIEDDPPPVQEKQPPVEVIQCPEGQERNGQECVTSCPQDQQLVNGTCEVATCSEGYGMLDGACVFGCQRYLTNTVLVDGICIPIEHEEQQPPAQDEQPPVEEELPPVEEPTEGEQPPPPPPPDTETPPPYDTGTGTPPRFPRPDKAKKSPLLDTITGYKKRIAARAPLGIVIANSRYKSKVIKNSRHAAPGAAAFVKFLQRDMHLPANRILTHSDMRWRNFVDLFGQKGGPAGRLKKILRDAPASDLIIYYSGRAMPVEGGKDAVLLPRDAKFKQPARTGYRLSELYKRLATLGVRRLRLYLDTAFSSPSNAQPGPRAPAAKPVRIAPALGPFGKFITAKWVIVSAGTGTQAAYADPKKPVSAFTDVLLSGLRGQADKSLNGNRDSAVTAGELLSYLRKNLSAIVSKATGGNQTPAMFGPASEILSYAAAAAPAAAAPPPMSTVKPSFNCARAYAKAEKAICGSPAIATLDNVMVELYKKARAARKGQARAALTAQQKAWLKQRNACGADIACLSQRYGERIGQLQ